MATKPFSNFIDKFESYETRNFLYLKVKLQGKDRQKSQLLTDSEKWHRGAAKKGGNERDNAENYQGGLDNMGDCFLQVNIKQFKYKFCSFSYCTNNYLWKSVVFHPFQDIFADAFFSIFEKRIDISASYSVQPFHDRYISILCRSIKVFLNDSLFFIIKKVYEGTIRKEYTH